MIDSETIQTWRINYGLDARTPADAMRWWNDKNGGMAPAGAVAALGLCLIEIERLQTEAVPEGLSLVPIKPTPAIRDALRLAGRRDWPSDELCDVRWAATLAAAQGEQP